MNRIARSVTIVFSVIILTCLILLGSTSCIRVGLVGSGNVVSEEREVSDFDKISVATGINLFVEQTGQETLIVEAEDNILPKIETKINNDILSIKIATLSLGGVNARKPINCYVSVKDITLIDASSGSSVETDMLKTDNLSIDLSSGSNAYFEVDVKRLDVDISSGSDVEISGDADSQTVDISSGSEYDALDLLSKEAVIDVSSGSSAEVSVSEELELDISSGSSVKYKGSPKVKSDISSGGSLQSVSD